MELTSFVYDDVKYDLYIDPSDPSGNGCVDEIVHRDEYILTNFKKSGGAIIDIGANCGVATIILAKQNPETIVYSFEPHIPSFNLLEKNVKVNNLTNVKAFNLAVSDVSGKTIKLFHSPICSGGNTTCSDPNTFVSHFDYDFKSQNKLYIESEIKTISLDDIISNNNIESIDLLKIDCEGAEFEILYNSKSLIDGYIKNMVGEFHDLIYNTQTQTTQNTQTTKNNSETLLNYCRNYIEGIVKISILRI